MRTFLVFNQITAEIIQELSSVKLARAVSMHTQLELENILSQFKDGDTLIIEGIHLFNGVSELYSALSFISNLSNGNFISLKQILIRIDKGQINKDILEVIGIGASLEERCLKQAENEGGNQAEVDSIMKSLGQLCIKVLEDNFKNRE